MLWRRLLDGWVLCGFHDTHLDIRSQYSILDSYCCIAHARVDSLVYFCTSSASGRLNSFFPSLSMITDLKSALEQGHFCTECSASTWFFWVRARLV